MTRMFIVFIFLVSIISSAAATEIQTDEETLLGTILGKQGDEIFFETANGIINIRKANILSIDGKPYIYAPPKPLTPPAPAPAVETLTPPPANITQ